MGSLTQETKKGAEISHPRENTGISGRLSAVLRAIKENILGLTQKGKSLAKDSIIDLRYESASQAQMPGQNFQGLKHLPQYCDFFSNMEAFKVKVLAWDSQTKLLFLSREKSKEHLPK